MRAHLAKHAFQPGNPGSPGRPKGSRSKLQETVLKALAEDFEIHGPDVIAKVRQRKPEVYLTAMVSLLPKQAQKIESPFADISDAELEALEQHLAVVRAKLVQDIEHEPQSDEPSRSRVADSETETHGQSIRENRDGDNSILDGSALILDDGGTGILDTTTNNAEPEGEAIMDDADTLRLPRKQRNVDDAA